MPSGGPRRRGRPGPSGTVREFDEIKDPAIKSKVSVAKNIIEESMFDAASDAFDRWNSPNAPSVREMTRIVEYASTFRNADEIFESYPQAAFEVQGLLE